MRRFLSNTKGNVAILFAFAVVPVIGAVGAAVDYSMASAYRTDLQKSLDATGLALSKILPADQATLDKVGRQYFDASMGANDLKDLTLTVTPGIGVITVRATANYAPKIAGVFGATEFPIGAESVARWGTGKVEVALALDNSLSMNELGRMTHLKAAAHDLLTILENAAQDEDDAKVSIIPFDANVRVVASPTSTWINNATWIRWDLWDAEEDNQNCSWSGSGKNKKKTCTPKSHTTWTGCVTDRNKDPNVNYDANDAEPTSSNATKYPAWQCYSNNLTTIMPLSTNWGEPESNNQTTLHGKVNAMTPSGYTNATIGLVWAFHALSPTPRMTEGAAYGTENLTKYIILLSDGNNTRDRWYECPPQGPCPTIDARTEAVCANIKTAGIKIYTIRLIDGNADLLRNCASETGMYKEVQQASDLSSVFNAIGAEIANLHLAK